MTMTIRPALAIAAAAATMAAPSLAQDRLIVEFEGQGTLNTRPFVVEAPWEIQWTADERISVYLYSVPEPGAEPRTEGVPLSDPDGGTGASYIPVPGRYYMEISTRGTWALRIVEVAP